jgi:hypothetical protein
LTVTVGDTEYDTTIREGNLDITEVLDDLRVIGGESVTGKAIQATYDDSS